MLKNKILRTISIIFQCAGIGGILLYVYNYFMFKRQYDIIPKEIKVNMNTYLLIGISGIILYIIFKILIHFTGKTEYTKEYEQLEINLDQEAPHSIGETYNPSSTNTSEIKYIYENINRYDVPLEKQMTCSNCGNIVDVNAFLCLFCGFLLKPFEIHSTNNVIYKEKEQYSLPEEKNQYDYVKETNQYDSLEASNPYNSIEEKNQYGAIEENNPYDFTSEVNKSEPIKVKEQYDFSKVYKSLLNAFIVILVVFGVYIAFNTANEKGLFKNEKESEEVKIVEFYDVANSIVNDVANNYRENKISLNKNTIYFTLSELGFTSSDYNADKSYIAINKLDSNDVKIYISLVGTSSYEKYSINITEIKDLDKTDVLTNTATISDINNKLLIDNGNTVTIYHKN